MRVAIFCHSFVSDWNHGNAHFLRGLVRELTGRGHTVAIYEPCDGWSRTNLLQDGGALAIAAIETVLRDLPRPLLYDPATIDLDAALGDVDLVLVHEWTDPALVAAIGRHRLSGGRYRLYFHDTHHRAVSAPAEIEQFSLEGYDAVLAFGEVLRELYVARGWARRAYTWHEAADVALFRPLTRPRKGDLVWIGNWGDGERSHELREFLLGPVAELGLDARIHGVRYPDDAKAALAASGIDYAGWLPNHRAPEIFAAFDVTVHVPRRWYVQALPGIPTIRVFEALACGIPLVSAPWNDAEGLFRPGTDYLVAQDGAAMQRALREILNDRALASELRAHGLATIAAAHTCAHRVDELLAIDTQIQGTAAEAA
jgi:spore maturation protein CgeB